MLWALLVIFSCSCAISMCANWAARAWARSVGLVDRPDGHRKLQNQAIPLAGGIAIFAAMLATIAALVAVDDYWRAIVLFHGSEALGLLGAGSLIILLGILDDSVGLRGRQKLAGQLVAAALLVACGICIERIEVMGWNIELGILSIPFTIFWLVGAINALNLLDGMDGLAGTLGLILSAAIAVMAILNGHHTIALIATVLAGSLVGFLRFNLPPASMYLGDAGSMLIGLLVGVMVIQASLKGAGTVLMAVPLALWTIPIFDSSAAVLRRTLTGRSIYTTDRAHLHHHLVDRMGHRMTLVCVGMVALVVSIAALASVWAKNDSIAIACAGFVVLMFISFRVFGHSELQLTLLRVRSLLRSIFHWRPVQSAGGWNDSVHLQGTREWGLLWEMLTECAAKLDFVQLRLDLNVPVLGEGYHAAWSRPTKIELNRLWRLDLPLIADKRVLGYLKVVGERDAIGGHNVEQLLDLLKDVELYLARLLNVEGAVSQPLDVQIPRPVPVADPELHNSLLDQK